LLLDALLLFSLLLISLLLLAFLLLPLLLVALLLLAFLLLPLLLVALLLLAFLLFPLLLVTLLLLAFLLFPLLLVALLLIAFLLFPLLLVTLLLLTFLLFLLLIGLPKHYSRRSCDQSKTKQKHGRLPGYSKCGCNYGERNRLTRQTFRHSCRSGVDGVAFDEGFGKTLREDRSRDTLQNHLGAAPAPKGYPGTTSIYAEIR